MKIKKGLSLLLVVLILALSLAACAKTQETEQTQQTEPPTEQPSVSELSSNETAAGETAQSPIVITDIEGRTIELDKPAERIVDCTGLGGTRILVQLEAEDLLVGTTNEAHNAITSSDKSANRYYPVGEVASELSELPNIGTYSEPDVQTIISLEPDVILVGWGGPDLAKSLQNQTGIPCVCIGRMDGNFDYDLYEIVGKVIGKEEKSAELISYLQETLKVVTDITDTIPAEQKKSIYFWIAPTIGNAPRSNGIYDAFEYAGAINVASTDDGMAMYETSIEQIAAWNPEYIFLQTYQPNLEGFYSLETLKEEPIISNIDAVVNGNVYRLRGPMSDWDTAIEATEVFYVAKILYPDLFVDLDVESYGNEIMKAFYGADGMYTDMREYSGLYTWD